METISHDGRTTAYRTGGGESGPTICYIHGAGRDGRIWIEQYGNPETPPAVVPDLSGHGKSDDVSRSPGTETLDAYADDVVSVCAETNATVLCGNSMGGAVAMWVALERDLELDALVLADTGAKLSVDPDFLDALSRDAAVESHVSDLFYRPTDALEGCVERSAAEAAVTRRDFETCDAFDVRDRVEGIRTPTLAVCGEHDSLTPPMFHEYLAETLPNCVYRQLADAAHVPMLEEPDAFNGAVRSFLDRQTAEFDA